MPGFYVKRTGNRQTDAVCVTNFQTQAGLFHGCALNIQRKDGGREGDTFFIGFQKGGTVDTLTTYDAVHVCNQQIDEVDFRMLGQKGLRFLDTDGLSDGCRRIRSG